ncbi:MAG: hypothetical protein KDA53_01250 [Hyphomonas sp.]|nr:hypothetical protein [Hyphomonas sp.]
MRYIRFESLEPCDGTACRLGIFQIAYRVRDAHATLLHDANELARLLRWFEDRMTAPDALEAQQNRRAICWFRDTAHEPIRHAWSMTPCLEPYGYRIGLRTSMSPGLIVYADGWQVAAIPR